MGSDVKMKNKITIAGILLILALAFMISSVSAQDVSKLKYPKLNKLEIPDVQRNTLDNGMRLYMVEDHQLPVYHMSVRINVGDYLDPADKVGMVGMMGEVLRTGGTAKWTGDEIDELLEGIGGFIETSSNTRTCGVTVNVLSDYTDLGLDILAQILRHPAFDEDKIDLARVNERSSISRRNDDPFTLAIREFSNVIYGPESPYARYPEYATVDAVTRDDLVEFHDKYFRPENIQVAIWGDFEPDKIVAKMTELFGDWPKGTAPVPPPPEVTYDYKQQVYFAEKSDINQAQILMGHIGGKVTDPDYAARIVMNTIMGVGFGSRMVDNVRSKEGLAYSAFSSYTAQIDRPGIFFNFAATKSETVGKAITEMVNVIKSMQTDPPTPDELAQGKDSYLNSFVFNFDTRSEVVNRMMNYDYYGLPEDFLQQTKEQVEKVTADDVVAAAKKNLHPDELRFMVVGKGEDFDTSLADLGFGPVDTVDITIPSGEVKRELAMTPENLEKGSKLLHAAAASLGGIENFKKINTVKEKGKFTLIMQGQELPLDFESARQLPDKVRTVVSFMGRQMYDIWNGSSGWKTDQMSGNIVAKSEDDLAKDRMENMRDFVVIFSQLDDPEFKAVYDGSGQVRGHKVEYVVLLDKSGETICRMAIDAESGRPVSTGYWGEAPTGEGNLEVFYADWKPINGVEFPMTLERTMEGDKIGTTSFTQIEVNADVAESAFSQPQ